MKLNSELELHIQIKSVVSFLVKINSY